MVAWLLVHSWVKYNCLRRHFLPERVQYQYECLEKSGSRDIEEAVELCFYCFHVFNVTVGEELVRARTFSSLPTLKQISSLGASLSLGRSC